MRLSTLKLTASTSNLEKIFSEFNATTAGYPRGKTIHRLVEEQCEKTPGNIALVEENECLTYRELSRQSNRLARFLLEQGCKQEAVVGILADHSTAAIVSMLAILKAGGVYLPLDPDTPYERLRFMLTDSGSGFLISQKKYIKTLNKLQWECPRLDHYLCIDSENVYQEKEEPNELMDKDLWDYIADTSHDDISGGAWFSSFTGEDISRREMDEYADNILDKLRPYLAKDTRVLEIGCSSGITMFRIAPHVKKYLGTDLSAKILDKTRTRLENSSLTNVTLYPLPAHEIDKIEEKDFDIVILNSVVQCFNGHNYLREVIGKSIRLLNDSGILFLGDIQDQESKESLLRELSGYKKNHAAKADKTKIDWSRELFLSRGFFNDLQLEFPAIEQVTHSEKLGELRNELTVYRFDTLLRINKNRTSPAHENQRAKRKKQLGQDSLVNVSQDAVHLEVNPGNAAYIIYTSGTTGLPKGCLVSHENILRLMINDRFPFDFSASDVWINAHAYNFDFSVWEIYGSLLYGGRLVIPKRRQVKDVEKFLSLIRKYNVTVLNQTPLAFNYLVNCEYGKKHADLANHLRYVIFGGDRLEPAKLEKWISKYPPDRIRLINMYGITETTVHVTFYELSAADVLNPVNLTRSPIGKPLPETTVYILDEGKKPVPVGTAGELYVGGTGVCRGYLNRIRLTAERFTVNPHNPGERIYRSGDSGKWLSDGTIEFIARKDRQVKIRGFRIEPAEIEHHLSNHAMIREAVVIARDFNAAAKTPHHDINHGESQLIAYIIPHDGSEEISVKQLRTYLLNLLPGYMVPAYFVSLTAFPLTPNGKIDKHALPAPWGKELKTGDEYRAPRDETERKLVEIWQRLLMVNKIGINDNYFNTGGDSIKAIRLVHIINNELAADLEIADLYVFDTIERLANRVLREKPPSTDLGLTRAREEIEALKTRIMSENNLDDAVQDLYPMSDIEKGMVFHSGKNPGQALYHDQTVRLLQDGDFGGPLP